MTTYRLPGRSLRGILLICLLAAAGPGAASGAGRTEAGVGTGTSSGSYSHASDPHLRELIGILLEENPELLAARSRSRSDLQRIPQARSLPDPQISYRYFALTPETRVGPQEHAIELSQSVPWKGKRGLQAERESSLALGAAWSAQELERRLVAELKRAYFSAAYLREALAINEEERDLLGRFESIALKRYATGEGIQQSVIKVQTDITRLDDRHTSLHQLYQSVVRRIAELIGRPDASLDLAPAPLRRVAVDHDPAELERLALSAHPGVRAAEQRVAADQAWSRRSALESRPDFRVGLGYTLVGDRQDRAGLQSPPDDNGQDVLSLMVGVSIPLYRQRILAGVGEARESLGASEEQLSSVRNRLRYLLQDALLRLDSLDERSRLYSEVLVPQAQESLASSEAAYTTGRQGFLDLLDAERVLFQVRLTYQRLISEYWTALTDIEFATASRFPPRAGIHPAPGRTGARSETLR